jgi:hypothetical protein
MKAAALGLCGRECKDAFDVPIDLFYRLLGLLEDLEQRTKA